MKKSQAVVMIGGGIQEVAAVETAQNLGFYTIVTDRDPNAPCFSKADKCVILDGMDVEGISSFILENKKAYNICGVFTCVNLGSSVAAIAARCGLPGVSPEAACLGDNKAAQKEALFSKGVLTPQFSTVDSYQHAVIVYKRIGPVVIIKPSDSFGGQGVHKVETLQDLNYAYEEAMKYSGGKPILMEEFVTGRFVDLEGIFCDDRFYPLAAIDSYFTDRVNDVPVSPIEYKNVYPSQLDEETIREIFNLTERAARAIGINFGPIATDVVLTERGPMIIEISARLHGISANLQMIPRATGIKPVEVLIGVMTGGEVNILETKPRFSRVSINRCLLPPPGVITSIAGLDQLSQESSIVKYFLFKGEGDRIEYRNSADVPAMVIAVADTLERAEAEITRAESLLIISTSSV